MQNCMHRSIWIALVCLLVVPSGSLFAQSSYEVGVLGAASVYRSIDVANGSTGESGQVGTEIGYGGGFAVGQNIGSHLGGEFRYLYVKNDYELDAGSQTIDFTGQAHLIHYDFLFYFSDTDASVRPYVAGGGGVKVYQGTGTEQPDQPFSSLAIFTETTETKLMGDFGVGVKVKVGGNGLFRVEFRDFITQVPKDVITPGPGSDLDGVLHQFAPIFGFSWTF